MYLSPAIWRDASATAVGNRDLTFAARCTGFVADHPARGAHRMLTRGSALIGKEIFVEAGGPAAAFKILFDVVENARGLAARAVDAVDIIRASGEEGDSKGEQKNVAHQGLLPSGFSPVQQAAGKHLGAGRMQDAHGNTGGCLPWRKTPLAKKERGESSESPSAL